MIQVVILTEEQKNQFIGQQYAPDSYFNPIQDLDNNWIISVEETQENVNPDTMWVKELPLIEFKHKPYKIIKKHGNNSDGTEVSHSTI